MAAEISLPNQPLVSVVITVYNGARFLGETLQAIQAQTYPNFEVIVVDDGSTDATPQILGEYASRDRRIKPFSPGRLGRGKALNFGVTRAVGELIAINDADDISLPERLEQQVNLLANRPECGLVLCNFIRYFVETGEKIAALQPLTDYEIKKKLTKGSCFSHSAFMFRKSTWEKAGKYSESRKFMFDRDLIVRIGAISKLESLQTPLVMQRWYNTSQFNAKFGGRERSYQNFLLRSKAIRVFGFPLYWTLSPLASLVWDFLPAWSHSLIPGRVRKIAVNKLTGEKNVR